MLNPLNLILHLQIVPKAFTRTHARTYARTHARARARMHTHTNRLEEGHWRESRRSLLVCKHFLMRSRSQSNVCVYTYNGGKERGVYRQSKSHSKSVSTTPCRVTPPLGACGLAYGMAASTIPEEAGDFVTTATVRVSPAVCFGGQNGGNPSGVGNWRLKGFGEFEAA